MPEAFICDAVRTPIGRYAGALAPVRPDDLAAIPIRALVARHPRVDWARVDDVILGCANQAGEDNRNVARMALLLAGIPHLVPGETVNRLCASGMSAVAIAARGVAVGQGDFYLAGGVEQMTRAPYALSKTAQPFGRDAQLFDTSLGWRFVNPVMKERYGTDSMGQTAENVAELLSIGREDQDRFAVRSQQKAASARSAGRFTREILPVETAPAGRGKPPGQVDQDEFIKPETSLDVLAKLKPAFRTDGKGSVTAGNSAGLNDGACSSWVCRHLPASSPPPLWGSSRGSWVWVRSLRRVRCSNGPVSHSMPWT
jgi:acetyl-CoA acetyltransferase family protein